MNHVAVDVREELVGNHPLSDRNTEQSRVGQVWTPAHSPSTFSKHILQADGEQFLDLQRQVCVEEAVALIKAVAKAFVIGTVNAECSCVRFRPRLSGNDMVQMV